MAKKSGNGRSKHLKISSVLRSTELEKVQKDAIVKTVSDGLSITKAYKIRVTFPDGGFLDFRDGLVMKDVKDGKLDLVFCGLHMLVDPQWLVVEKV